MSEIVLTDDDLKSLERRFGPSVRYMGSWNSDGVFGYCSVPVAAVENAVNDLNDPLLRDSLHQLKNAPERTARLMEMLDRSGALVERIVAAHQQRFRIKAISMERGAVNRK